MTRDTTMVARCDPQDRLLSADAAFDALNARAGGRQGQVLAVPQLATIVRLARRLGIRVARGVTLADEDADIECWVRGTPDAAGVEIALTVLQETSSWRTTAAASPPDTPPPAGADWTWETDAALRITRLSPLVAARHGIDTAEAIGRPLTRLFALEPDANHAMPILEAAAARRDFDGQAASVRESGRPVTLSATARRGAGGAFAGFVGGTFEDEADGGDLTPAFNSRLDTILRGPLGRIVANADSINAGDDGPIEPHYADYAADIASAARHLIGLVDDLVDLEAIERSDFTIASERLDLADVARRAAGLLGVRAADAGVRIETDAPPEGLEAKGEFRRVLQILVNLIGNAIRYAPRDTAVTLTLRRDGDRALVTVADAGRGIEAADQERIFRKFERLDLGGPGNSGLGLYIARQLARAMKGDLTVESAPGVGARFTLALPG